MADKLHWMPFYGQEFYESERVRLMDRAERAVLLQCLWRQWREGSLPPEPERMARVVEVAPDELTPAVLEHFPIGEDGRRRNARLEAIRQEQEAKVAASEEYWRKVREDRSRAGRAGRAKQLAQASPGQRPDTAQANPGLESESETDITTTYLPAAGKNSLTAPLGELGEAALQGYLRASRNPDTLRLELNAILSGLHSPGGVPVSGEQLGRAIHDMSVAGVPMSPRRLRAFVQGVLEGDPPPKRTSEEGSSRAMADWVRAKEAEIARKESAKNGHA